MESISKWKVRPSLSPVLGLALAFVMTGFLFTSITLVFTAGSGDVPAVTRLAQAAAPAAAPLG